MVSAVILTVGANAQKLSGLSIGGGVVHNFYVLNDRPNVNFDNCCYFGPYVELGYDWNVNKAHGMYFGVRYEFVHHYTGAGAYAPSPYYPYYTVIGAEAYTYRHYIDVPIKYRFIHKFNKYNKFFFDLGPTCNFMVGNVSRLNEYIPGFWAGQKINWYDAAPNAYNWFNLSVGTNIGVILGQAKVFIGYDYGGILSYTKEQYGRGQVHQLRIGAAYMF